MKKYKQIAIFSENLKTGKEECVGLRRITPEDIRRYFNSIRNKRNYKEYCERCGAGIGKQKLYKNIKIWKNFYLCEDCYEHKINHLPESIPDLEDLLALRV